MRVFLALQITSQTCIKMIKDHCECNDNIEVIEDYKPMIELFESVDRPIDIIMNGNGYKAKNRNVELINKLGHKHIFELFDILCVFEEWKSKGDGKFTGNFITKYTYEDLVWMVFGVATHASLYLDEDGTKTMHQGKSGTDVCGHFFQ